MEQLNTTHSPRVDDVLAEVEAEAPIPGALGEDERRRRSELAIALRPSVFPAQREALMRVALEEHAADWVIDLLEQLPLDTRFDTVGDIWLALGGHDEVREPEPVPAAEPVAAAAPTEPVEPLGDERNVVLASLDLGVGLGITVVHSALAATRWAVRTAGRVFDRAA